MLKSLQRTKARTFTPPTLPALMGSASSLYGRRQARMTLLKFVHRPHIDLPGLC